MNNQKNYKKYIILLLTVILSFCLCGCKGNISEYSKTGFAFDTVIEITIYDTDKNHADIILNECLNICDYYDRLFNISDTESDIYRINNSKGNPISVSEDTIDIINKSIKYSEISDGLLDITIGSLYELWDFNNSNHLSLPPSGKITEAINNTNYKEICIDTTNKTITVPKYYKINLGAIAKGYIADKIKEYLISKNIESAIINLGGNILTIGSKPNGEDYNIGIQKPFSSTGEMITSVSTHDKSVVTSGTYQRFFTFEDKNYHHIINPKTGYPADTDLSSVTIICDSSTDADAYSTICMLMGYKKAIEFINNQTNVSAIFIDENGDIIN